MGFKGESAWGRGNERARATLALTRRRRSRGRASESHVDSARNTAAGHTLNPTMMDFRRCTQNETKLSLFQGIYDQN